MWAGGGEGRRSIGDDLGHQGGWWCHSGDGKMGSKEKRFGDEGGVGHKGPVWDVLCRIFLQDTLLDVVWMCESGVQRRILLWKWKCGSHSIESRGDTKR